MLQKLQGCFEGTEQPFAIYGGAEFTRCPVLYVDPKSLLLMRMAEDEYLKQIGPERCNALPAKRHQAVWHITNYLLKLRKTHD